MEPRSRSGQRTTHSALRFASTIAGHDIAFACGLAAKVRDLHSVQFLSDTGLTHRMVKHLQPLAQVLQAAERHITDCDMDPDRLWEPVIDRSNLEIMLLVRK